ncbi:MAG: Hsp20/alpha crystallin family protein, partial [Candidatus Poribacteria bacterium]|nr:Hsp20/alpha crystallin family protein [Candidatus Poribacteria bacterium]
MKYRRDPFGEFFEVQKQIDQVFDYFQERSMASLHPERNFWRPPIDVYETAETFIVRVELPGIRPDEDVKVELADNVLTIRGHRRDRSSRKKQHYHIAEINYGPFERMIALPDAIDEDASPIAHYEDGFLEVVLPKEALQVV